MKLYPVQLFDIFDLVDFLPLEQIELSNTLFFVENCSFPCKDILSFGEI